MPVVTSNLGGDSTPTLLLIHQMLRKSKIAGCQVHVIELTAERKHVQIQHKAFCSFFPGANGSIYLQLLAWERALEELLNDGKRRLSAKNVLDGELDSLFKLKLGVE